MAELEIRDSTTGLTPFGPVEMRVPCDPLASRVIRLAASGVASLGGFDVNQIEDINMAVSEVLIALIEHGTGESIEVQFVVDDRSFTVRGRTVNNAFDADDTDLILCRTVLAGVSSEHGIEHVDDHAQIWAVIDHVAI
jgi:anti-sigma regulatory factor (Ser/Thr protein kinase)